MRLTLLVSLLTACSAPPPATGPTTPAPAVTRATPVQPAEEPPPPVDRSNDRLSQLYRCWFESPYSYMFGDDGTFTAGTKGIVYYGNLSGCMGRLTDGSFSRVVGDYKPIEAFSGLEVLVGNTGAFRSFNPALIRWGHENLIPPPDLLIDGMTARDRYRSQFSRFFRLMTETYLTLRSSLKLDAEMSAYKAAVDGGADGLDYLESRFAGRLPGLAMPANGTALTVPMAFGFWLRRGIDGTAEELWIGLRKVMRLYDPEWYAAVQERYPTAAVNW